MDNEKLSLIYDMVKELKENSVTKEELRQSFNHSEEKFRLLSAETTKQWDLIRKQTTTLGIHEKEIYGNGKPGLCTKVERLRKDYDNMEKNYEVDYSSINGRITRITWAMSSICGVGMTIVFLLMK